MAWVDISKTWHDTNVDYCDVCGNLLIRRAWEFTGADGTTLRACREDDERLHRLLREYAPAIEEARATAARAQSAAETGAAARAGAVDEVR
jgi:hypothetical protein